MKSQLFTMVLVLLFQSCMFHSYAAESDVSLTVYSTADPSSFDPQKFISQQRGGYNQQYAWQVPGFGVVKEVRPVKLQSGRNTVRFSDVAQFIDPTTVSIVDLTNQKGTTVLEQNFQFDLVSPQKLLQKYVDRNIELTSIRGDSTESISGKLLSSIGHQMVLNTDQGIRVISNPVEWKLGDLPGGLITRPALVWELNTNKAGNNKLRTTYQTNGITWRSDYNLIVSGDDKRADLGAWVTLMNLSGATYKNATLKLIAGDVQRIQPNHYGRMREGRMAAKSMAMDVEGAGFQQKSFGEYHLYTLPRKTDVKMNSTQQIMLFPTASDVKVEKLLVYYGLPQAHQWTFGANPATDRHLGNQSNKKVDVYYQFENEKKNNLGIPLPKGKVRLYKEDDADGTLEFIGEDLIDHTPKDEKVLVRIGQAFDVIGERTQKDYNIQTSKKELTETFEIVLKNHKETAQKVIIKENLFRWVNWKIAKHSDEYKKIDSRTIHFEVDIPAGGEKKVEYTVRYNW